MGETHTHNYNVTPTIPMPISKTRRNGSSFPTTHFPCQWGLQGEQSQNLKVKSQNCGVAARRYYNALRRLKTADDVSHRAAQDQGHDPDRDQTQRLLRADQNGIGQEHQKSDQNALENTVDLKINHGNQKANHNPEGES